VTGAAAASGGSLLAAEVDETPIVATLQAGDEAAFRDLVTRYHAPLVRLSAPSADTGSRKPSSGIALAGNVCPGTDPTRTSRRCAPGRLSI